MVDVKNIVNQMKYHEDKRLMPVGSIFRLSQHDSQYL